MLLLIQRSLMRMTNNIVTTTIVRLALALTLSLVLMSCVLCDNEGPRLVLGSAPERPLQLAATTTTTTNRRPRLATDLPTPDVAARSGARSAYPMAAFGGSSGLFNDWFNIFRRFSRPSSSSQTLAPNVNNNNNNGGDQSSQLLSGGSVASHQLPTAPSTTILASDKTTTSSSLLGVSHTATAARGSPPEEPSSPVILVPGYGGSRLEARLNKPSVVRYVCDSRTDWFDIWINLKLLFPYMIDCLIDNLRLEFDEATNTTRNTAGVEIRVKNASQVSSVEYLHNLPLSNFAYFAFVIDELVDKLGYKREQSLVGAPYDFRKAPNEMDEYFRQLKETSERVYQTNGLKPISFICHSMGCNNMLYFLQRQTQQWKDTHVRRLISVAAPWGGCLSALRAAAMGDDLGVPYLLSEAKLIHVQRSLPSTMYLFPHRQVFAGAPLITTNVVDPGRFGSRWANSSMSATLSRGNKLGSTQQQEPQQTSNNHDPPTTKVEEKHYTAQDFRGFFNDISHPDGYRMWLNTKDLLGSLEAPGVEVWCLVGRGQQTLGRMEYMGEFPYSPRLELFDDGDGTVTLESASYCRKWAKQQKLPIHYKEFQVGHVEIIRDELLRKEIAKILGE